MEYHGYKISVSSTHNSIVSKALSTTRTSSFTTPISHQYSSSTFHSVAPHHSTYHTLHHNTPTHYPRKQTKQSSLNTNTQTTHSQQLTLKLNQTRPNTSTPPPTSSPQTLLQHSSHPQRQTPTTASSATRIAIQTCISSETPQRQAPSCESDTALHALRARALPSPRNSLHTKTYREASAIRSAPP